MTGLGKKIFLLNMLLLLLAACGSGFCRRAEASEITGFKELEDKRIGVTTGSVQAQQAEARFPDAQFYYYSTSTDLLNALRADKISLTLVKSAAHRISCETTDHETRKNRIRIRLNSQSSGNS